MRQSSAATAHLKTPPRLFSIQRKERPERSGVLVAMMVTSGTRCSVTNTGINSDEGDCQLTAKAKVNLTVHCDVHGSYHNLPASRCDAGWEGAV